MRQSASFFEIQIAGLKAVGDRTVPASRRILWTLAILSCFGLSLWYVIERTKFFVTNPVQSSITLMEEIRLPLPDVTVCTRHRFNMAKLSGMWKNFTGRTSVPDYVEVDILDYVDAPTLWEEAAYKLHDIIHECKYMLKKSCLPSSHWTPIMTAYGKCWTLRGPILHSSGEKYGLKVVLKRGPLIVPPRERGFLPMQPSWQVVAHARGVPPEMLILQAGIVTRVWNMNGTDGVEYGVEEIKRISITVEEYASLPQGDSHCIPDENYTYEACDIHCFESIVLQETGCRMSFMNHVEGPLCRTKAEVENVIQYLDKVTYLGAFDFSSCRCSQQCKETVYKVSIDTVQRKVPAGTGKPQCLFYFPELRPTVTHVAETPAYEFMNWFTQVGGVSNLLLGVSLLTFVEIVDILCVKICNQFTRR